MNSDGKYEAAQAICFQCRQNGPPTHGAKGGGDGSLVKFGSVDWWHKHGDYQTRCQASALWDDNGWNMVSG